MKEKRRRLPSLTICFRHPIIHTRSQTIDRNALARGFELFHSVGCVACHSPRDERAKEQWSEDAESTPLGNLSDKYNVDGLTRLLNEPLAVRPSGHMPNMQLTHREAVEIANFLLQSTPQQEEQSWVVDASLAEQGKTRFAAHNCVNCHTDFANPNAPLRHSKGLEQLDLAKGCLSESDGPHPQFGFGDLERKLIRAALQNQPQPFDQQQQIDFTLATF